MESTIKLASKIMILSVANNNNRKNSNVDKKNNMNQKIVMVEANIHPELNKTSVTKPGEQQTTTMLHEVVSRQPKQNSLVERGKMTRSRKVP